MAPAKVRTQKVYRSSLKGGLENKWDDKHFPLLHGFCSVSKLYKFILLYTHTHTHMHTRTRTHTLYQHK